MASLISRLGHATARRLTKPTSHRFIQSPFFNRSFHSLRAANGLFFKRARSFSNQLIGHARMFSNAAPPVAVASFSSRMRTLIGEANIVYILHFGNFWAVCAMTSDDMLFLRSFMIGASCCGIVYNILQPIPLVPAACWGLFFLTGHSVQIARLMMDKQAVTMNEMENDLYERAFLPFGFSPRHFRVLFDEADGAWRTVKADEFVVKQDNPIEKMHFLLCGSGLLEQNGKVVGKMKSHPGHSKGAWCGEPWDPDYEFHKDHRWEMSLRAKEECKMVSFNLQKFYAKVKENKAMIIAADKLQISDVWGKLHHSMKFNQRRISKLRESAYESMLRLAMVDGVITRDEAVLCRQYRCMHDITDQTHKDLLQKLGCSVKEVKNFEASKCGDTVTHEEQLSWWRRLW